MKVSRFLCVPQMEASHSSSLWSVVCYQRGRGFSGVQSVHCRYLWTPLFGLFPQPAPQPSLFGWHPSKYLNIVHPSWPRHARVFLSVLFMTPIVRSNQLEALNNPQELALRKNFPKLCRCGLAGLPSLFYLVLLGSLAFSSFVYHSNNTSISLFHRNEAIPMIAELPARSCADEKPADVKGSREPQLFGLFSFNLEDRREFRQSSRSVREELGDKPALPEDISLLGTRSPYW